MRRLPEETQKDGEIEEIFSHVKQLKADHEKFEDTIQDKIEGIKTIKDNTGKILGEANIEGILPEDIFEIVGPEELLAEDISKMKVDIESSGTCDICGKEFVFEENLSGLTIRGTFFTCEKCCQDASKETLDGWVNYKNEKPENTKPIALWLIQEKNKTQLFE